MLLAWLVNGSHTCFVVDLVEKARSHSRGAVEAQADEPKWSAAESRFIGAAERVTAGLAAESKGG